LKGDAAGKTGTSRDGWFVGYTPNLVCAVWVGFDDHRDLGLPASESALPIWTDFIKRALRLRPSLGGVFVQPSGLTTFTIDQSTGLLASPFCETTVRGVFVSGTEPRSYCYHSAADLEELEDPPTADGIIPIEQELKPGSVIRRVCAETGLLPSSDCKSTRSAVVELTDLPNTVCNPALHKKKLRAPNP
jgi:penicillin-binding protein 1B